ncbi:hypothetical protein HML84_20895 [Alcanivorax sp. IO_7]|nr:hypothetical protein HML84_20895 [Alcanivorax sp. IO_7]
MAGQQEAVRRLGEHRPGHVGHVAGAAVVGDARFAAARQVAGLVAPGAAVAHHAGQQHQNRPVGVRAVSARAEIVVAFIVPRSSFVV